MKLPIFEVEARLLEAVARGNRVVLEAPTGSGKSTQTPQMLLKGGFLEKGEAIVLQPRRIAARLLAKRVAWELGGKLGDVVGYQIRHEHETSAATKIRFVTEGILLRRMVADPELRGVSVLIFDEFHERSLHADITLARAVMLQRQSRPDLKIIVMSATLDTETLRGFLDPCEVVRSEGRVYPIELRYIDGKLARSQAAVWDLAAQAAREAVREVAEGHVLIFMPGSYEINRTLRALGETLSANEFQLLPLHSELSPKDQDLAVEASERRKVIVATNVAETSLTIDNVRVVIDGGQARIARYDPSRGINTLWIEKIGDAAAKQRMGRSGRTAAGICIRLWTEADHAQRPLREAPEIARMDLAETLLTLKATGVEDLDTFLWVEKPEVNRMQDGLLLLRRLGAIDKDGKLTGRGKQMSAMPLHPRYAAMMLEAARRGCADEMAVITAITQSRGLLLRKVDKAVLDRRERIAGSDTRCDFIGQIRIWEAVQARRFDFGFCEDLGVHAQTARQVGMSAEQIYYSVRPDTIASRSGPVEDSVVRRCLLVGFPDRVCRRLDRGTLRCDMVGGKRGMLSRDSMAAEAELFVACEANEIGQQSGEVSTVLSLCSEIERAWLDELYPDAFDAGEEVVYDEKQKRVIRRKFAKYLDLILEAKEDLDVDLNQAAEALAKVVIEGKAKLELWDDAAEEFICRVNLIANAFPEYGIDPIDGDARALITEQCCHGARSVKDLKRQAVMPVLVSWIGRETASVLDTEAPTRIALPSGRFAKVRYSEKERPVVSAKIQELYDIKGGFALCQGRVKPKIELLAPNMRPVQLTDDLDAFWTQSYPAIKKDLKGRYPKHVWR